ncbi:nicotinamide riboside transporter PnuC [Portibacter marinus]|uniref:nicotinamide riboside transporter PnuC n=1 Tax=Portibacter marinus TaxID=2898660 RepID=UPI001F238765|nr:nicotinamide riboside transporter PnuC [Portibacter marinus]
MLETLSGFSIIEWIGLITGVIYVVLSARNRIECWYFGIISCACIAYHDFLGGLQLYSDGILQIFYIIMGFIGLARWRNVKVTFDAKFLTHILIILIGILVSLIYGYLMSAFSNAAFPRVDAFTTVFSIIATIFLVNRQVSAWLYFVIIDLVMTYLYYVRGWELYALLYMIFTAFAIYGSYNWLRLFRQNLNN